MTDRLKTRARPTRRQSFTTKYSDLMAEGYSRRTVLKGLLAGTALATSGLGFSRAAAATNSPSSLTFPELTRLTDKDDHWPEGYSRQILIKWGDKLFADSPAFDIASLDGAAAEKQFGYNNDFTAFLPLPQGSEANDHGLLVVNHEYASPYLMFPGLTDEDYRDKLTDAQIRAVAATTGISVVEVKKSGAEWRVVTDGQYNRRVHMGTEMRLSGPAAGDDRLKTSIDPTGTIVFGSISNCSGGVTPWGTMLSGEEGGMDVFAGDYTTLPDQELVERQGWDEDENDGYALGRVDARLKFENEPNEWLKFDWVVEIDPFDPTAKPVKRTALGRFTHEGAQVAVAPDGRVVLYMGDDDDFEYLYKFVTSKPWNPTDRAANKDLLDEGTLYTARFDADGKMTWLPLVQGQGPLTPENGFHTQADVVLRTRMAADLLGATPMDAPEGFVPHPKTGRVYIAMTENEDRLPAGEGDAGEQVNVANTRAPNPDGHILEITPPGAPDAPDHAATDYTWDAFILCGDPTDPASHALCHPETSANGWFTDPDNLSVDPAGRLWVTTDGPPDAGFNDALYAADTEGDGKALPKLFYLPPVGSEVCSPAFTPDGKTMFLSIQHPGELRLEDGEDSTSVADAGTNWPDFIAGQGPRPSLVVITKDDGGVVGS